MNRFLASCAIAFSVLSIQQPVVASVLVAPFEYTNTSGDNGSTTPTQANPRTWQQQIAASELAAMPIGSMITGLTWRLAGSTSDYPAGGPVTWSDYEITFGQAANPIGAMSGTFADNMISPVLVRDGPLTFQTGSFLSGGDPKAFGVMIIFNTPYIYQGGDLVWMLTHNDSDTGETEFIDGVVGGLGYGTLYQELKTNAFQATTATELDDDFKITQFQFTTGPTAVPEPASFALLGLGIAGLGFSRRKRS